MKIRIIALVCVAFCCQIIALPALAADGGLGVGDSSSTGGAGTKPQSPTPKSSGHKHQPGSEREGLAPLLRDFAVDTAPATDSGQGALVTYEIDDRDRSVRVSLKVMSATTPQVLLSKDLGRRQTDKKQRYLLSDLQLGPGQYRVVLSANDTAGHKLKTKSVARIADFKVSDHYFPVEGQWSWSGPGGEFGASRPGHIHQGFDIIAPEGSHVVAPASASVSYVDFQPEAAGYYVVLHSTDGYDYAFMHLREGSIRVKKGDPVAAGTWIADVGATGDAVGPHLHFEAWQGAWWAGGHPIDPKPLLQQWSGSIASHSLTSNPDSSATPLS